MHTVGPTFALALLGIKVQPLNVEQDITDNKKSSNKEIFTFVSQY